MSPTWPPLGAPTASAIGTRRACLRPFIPAQMPLSTLKQAFELALGKARGSKVQPVATS